MTAIRLQIDDVVYQVHGRGDSAERDKCAQQLQQVLLTGWLVCQDERYDQQAILDPLVRPQGLEHDEQRVYSLGVAAMARRLIHEVVIRWAKGNKLTTSNTKAAIQTSRNSTYLRQWARFATGMIAGNGVPIVTGQQGRGQADARKSQAVVDQHCKKPLCSH